MGAHKPKRTPHDPYTEEPDGRFTFDLRLAPMDAALLCLTLQEEEPA